MKWIGAFLILLASGFYGFQIANQYHIEIRSLRKLIRVLDYMSSELQYRLTPLPDLCRQAANEADGIIRKLFLHFSEELDSQISPDVKSCMDAALSRCKDMPGLTKQCLMLLGNTMGRFDLPGQVQALDTARASCRNHLSQLESGKEVRLRSYRTYGICAGAALVILFV